MKGRIVQIKEKSYPLNADPGVFADITAGVEVLDLITYNEYLTYDKYLVRENKGALGRCFIVDPTDVLLVFPPEQCKCCK